MDEATRQMLADLGGERLALVSAPSADAKGRPIYNDPRQEAAILQRYKDRKQCLVAGSAQKDEKAQSIAAWNSVISVIDDENGMDGHENRYGGQGHRENLTSSIHHKQGPWALRNPRYGGDDHIADERRIFLEQRQQRQQGLGGLYESIHAGSAKPPSNGHTPHRPGPSRDSGSFTTTPRGRSTAIPTSHTRAASPRSHGTVRFGPGGQRVEPATVPPAVMHRAAAQDSSSAKTLAAKDAPVLPKPCATPDHTAVPRPSPGPAPHIVAQMKQMNALWHAANPGDRCDEYYAKNPDQLDIYTKARDQLIKEALYLVQKGVEEDIESYISKHKDRRWMVDAARQSKILVMGGNQTEVDKFEAASPRHKLFIDAARAVFEHRKQPLREDPKAVESTSDRKSPISRYSSNSSGDMKDGADASSSGSSVDSLSSTEAPSTVESLGMLTASLFNTAGELIGCHQLQVASPVHVTMSFHSRSPLYDPRELIEEIESMAEKMKARRHDYRRQNHGFAGVRVGDGGLWDENDADDDVDEVL